MSEWYFAYGSNLCIEQVIARIGPIDQEPRRARLPAHRLAFNMRWQDGQVYANLIPASASALGVLYRCSAEALTKMDAFEIGYQRRHVRVVLEDGVDVSAIAYIAEVAYVAEETQPGAEYLQRILRGARRHGLPEDYLRGIEQLAGAVS